MDMKKAGLLLLTLLTALPPGWCCELVRSIHPHTTAPVETAPASDDCCCCCPKLPAPSQEQEKPARQPRRSWCCVRPPADKAKPEIAPKAPAVLALDGHVEQ